MESINSETHLALTSAALAGDSGGLYKVASHLMEEGIPFDSVLYDYLMPAEKDLGQRWQQGDYLVSEEHAATATIETVIALLAGMFDQPVGGDHYVVAAVQGDQHSLPGRAIAANLLFLGFRTTFLGPNLLAAHMTDYLESENPTAVVASAAMTTHLGGARAMVEASHQAGVPILVGGGAFGEDGSWADRIGADAWAPTLRDVPVILESWDPDPEMAERQAMQPSEALIEHRAIRATVLATAFNNADGDTRVVSEAEILLDAIASSLLVGDQRIVLDMVEWQRETMEAHGYEDGYVAARALQPALEDACLPCAGLLADAIA